MSPLMRSAMLGKYGMLDCLLLAGADKHRKNAKGDNALQVRPPRAVDHCECTNTVLLQIAMDYLQTDCAERLRDRPHTPDTLECVGVTVNEFSFKWGPQHNNGAPVDHCELQWKWLWSRMVDPQQPKRPAHESECVQQ